MPSPDFSESLPSSLPKLTPPSNSNGSNGSGSNGFSSNGSGSLDSVQVPAEPAKFEELEEFSSSANRTKPLAPSGPSNKSVNSWLSGNRGIFAGLGLGVLLTLGAVKIATSAGTEKAPAAAETASAVTAQSVTVAPVSRAVITETIAASGTVNAADLLPVAAATAGLQIQQVLVQEGDQVAAGQTLAVLDNSVLQAQLNQAQASLQSAQSVIQQKQAVLAQAQATANKAQSDANRYEQLASKGAVSQQDLENYRTTALNELAAVSVAQADIDSARSTALSQQAQVQQLETQIGQTAVLAPASGLIAEKMASVGEVTGSDPLFSIIQDGALELDALVGADQLPRIKIGAPVRVSSDSNAQIQLVGNVQEISPLVNNETRQATVKVSLPSSDQLRPGLFLKAAITAESNQGITVPAKAVLPQPDGSSLVYVLADGKAQAKPVQVGAIQTDAASRDSANSESSSDRIAIKSGLALGDRVIVSGAGYLKDGQSVTVASEEPSSTSATSTKPNSFTAPSNPSSASSGTSDNNRRSATTP